jgi:hypothetical protein
VTLPMALAVLIQQLQDQEEIVASFCGAAGTA